jgi:hypothetical protein
MKARVQHFFDPRTFTLTYVVFDPVTRDAVVIDPVLDYEPVGSYTFTESADHVIAFLRRERLEAGRRALRYQTTIDREKRDNPQLNATTTREQFIALRNARDAGLDAPKLLYQSVQVNIDGGHLPAPHRNGTRYLLLPINLARPADEFGRPLSGGPAQK